MNDIPSLKENSTEPIIDLATEVPNTAPEKIVSLAAFGAMANRAMRNGDVAEEEMAANFLRYHDMIKAGESDEMKLELARQKGAEISDNSTILQNIGISAGETDFVKAAIDEDISFNPEDNKDTIIYSEMARDMVDGGLVDSDRAMVAIKNISDEVETFQDGSETVGESTKGKKQDSRIEGSFEESVQNSIANAAFIESLISKRMEKLEWDWDTITDGLMVAIPGFTAWFQQQRIETKNNPIFTGQDLKQQKDFWDRLTLEEKAVEAKKIDEWIDSTGNDLNGMMFWSYMGELTDGHVLLEDVGSVLDGLFGAGLLIRLPARLIRLFGIARNASVSVVAGNRAAAASQAVGVTEGVKSGQVAANSPEAIEAADLSTVSALIPEASTNVGVSQRVEKQIAAIDKSADDILSAQVNTIVDDATARAHARKAVDEIIEDSVSSGGWVDVHIMKDSVETDIAGNYTYRITYGATDGLGFPTAKAALEAGENLKLSNVKLAALEENGTYYLQVDKHLEGMGDLVPVYDLEKLDGAGGARRWLASTNNMVAPIEARAASLTLATRELTTAHAKVLTGFVNKLSKKEKAHLGEVMEQGRRDQVWFSGEELKMGTHPFYSNGLNDKQIAAYHALRRMDDIEYMIENTLRYGRLKRESYLTLELKGTSPISKELGEFNAKPLDVISNPSNKSIYNASTGKYLVNNSPKDIENLKGKGYKIYSLEAGEDIKDSHPIQFIVAKDTDLSIRPLSTRQMEYLPGGRMHYRGEFFVKQGRLRDGPGSTQIMLSPKVWGVASKEEATLYASEMERGRKVALEGGTAAEMAEATGGRFTTVQAYRDIVGKNINMPFEVVEDGKDLVSVNKALNETNAAALAEDLIAKNSIQRMLKTRGRTSSRGRHLNDFTGNAAPVISVEEASRKSLDRALNLISLETWKDKQVIQFAKTFKSVLKSGRNKTPMDHFLNPQFINPTLDGEKQLIRQAKVMQTHYKKILNTKTADQVLVERGIARMVDWIAPKLNLTADSVQNLKAMDPIQFARSMTFHFKLGMGNMSQPFIQIHASAMMAAASPVQGTKAVLMAPHIRMMLMSDNPTTLGMLAKAASKATPGTNSEVMKEALDVVKRAGTWKLGAGSLAEQDIIQAGGSAGLATKFLEAGATPFMETERFNKIAGTTASYLEWRKLNPTAKITDEVIDKIRLRGEQLVGSMNRIDHADWQRGILGSLTQFWSWQARNMEIWLPTMMGGSKTFTAGEKARVFLGQVGLYGIEGFVGGGTGMFLVEQIRESYNETFGDEIDPDLLDLIADGVVDKTLLTLLDIDVNTHYRTGLGLTDSGWGELVTKLANIKDWRNLLQFESAPVTTVSDTIVGISNIFSSLSAVNTRITTKEGWDFVAEEFKESFLRNISAYTRAEKMVMALKTGNTYDSLGGVTTRGLSTAESIGIAFGFDPADSIDPRFMEQAIKIDKSIHKKHVQTLTKSLREAGLNGTWRSFEFAKETILGTVDDDQDKIDIMSRVWNSTTKNVKESYMRQFGPDAQATREESQ